MTLYPLKNFRYSIVDPKFKHMDFVSRYPGLLGRIAGGLNGNWPLILDYEEVLSGE